MGGSEATDEVKTTQSSSADQISTPLERGSVDLSADVAVKVVRAGRARDVDVAAEIIAEYGHEMGNGWTPAEEKKLIRKVDLRMVPIVSLPIPQYVPYGIKRYKVIRMRYTLGPGQDSHLRRGHLWLEERS